jgi:hypothetical protein
MPQKHGIFLQNVTVCGSRKMANISNTLRFVCKHGLNQSYGALQVDDINRIAAVGTACNLKIAQTPFGHNVAGVLDTSRT